MRHSLNEVIAIMLWWAEGTKARKDKRWKNAWAYNVELTNTNPEIIKLFLGFLRSEKLVDESRLKLQLQIHEGDSQGELEKYWSVVTNIPRERFGKTIIRPAGRKKGKTNGTCKIRYSDKHLYLKLMGILSAVLEDAKCE